MIGTDHKFREFMFSMHVSFLQSGQVKTVTRSLGQSTNLFIQNFTCTSRTYFWCTVSALKAETCQPCISWV